MAQKGKLKKLVSGGINLEQEIPRLVNEGGQHRAALELGVSQYTISNWLKQNGYELKMSYVKRVEAQ